jgi:hypothetical protein
MRQSISSLIVEPSGQPWETWTLWAVAVDLGDVGLTDGTALSRAIDGKHVLPFHLEREFQALDFAFERFVLRADTAKTQTPRRPTKNSRHTKCPMGGR